MGDISRNFSAAEFKQPARHGFEAEPYPAEWRVPRLMPLCMTLETIREALGGRAIRILSGYRTAEYNRKIGGARNSQHVQGRAADFVVKGLDPRFVHDTVLGLYNVGRIAIGGLGLYPGFTHIDTRQGARLARWKGSRAA